MTRTMQAKKRVKRRVQLKVRIPVPKPTRFHSTPKGKKGYNRKRVKQESVSSGRME